MTFRNIALKLSIGMFMRKCHRRPAAGVWSLSEFLPDESTFGVVEEKGLTSNPAVL